MSLRSFGKVGQSTVGCSVRGMLVEKASSSTLIARSSTKQRECVQVGPRSSRRCLTERRSGGGPLDDPDITVSYHPSLSSPMRSLVFQRGVPTKWTDTRKGVHDLRISSA